MARRVSVGVVGLGGPGHLHAYSVLESGIGHLEAVCGLSDLRRENFDADYRTWTKSSPPAVQKVKEFDEVLANPAIDAVYHSTHTGRDVVIGEG
jgi:predicted dehydrogenase